MWPDWTRQLGHVCTMLEKDGHIGLSVRIGVATSSCGGEHKVNCLWRKCGEK